MLAAIVDGMGMSPRFGAFEEPVAGANERLVHVTASALNPLARGRASGAHYSSDGRFPFVAGIDGAGRLEDGRRVYFMLPRPPFGAFAERTVVADGHWFELPDAIDDRRAALIANPGMSSWAALSERARIAPGETVLINGATGASGQLAVRIARHLGAGKIIVTGRNIGVLEQLDADAIIPLGGDPDIFEATLSDQFADGIDVVLDYLWGPSARALLIVAAKAGVGGKRIRFVQIGSLSGAEIALPAAVLRSSSIEMIGSGLGSIGLGRLVAAIRGVIEAAVPIGLDLGFEAIPLRDISAAWSQPHGSDRLVFSVG
jgi:NADPH:quinone reductase-like Zn-dependent oxidoreductase